MKFIWFYIIYFSQSVILTVGWKTKLSNILDISYDCPLERGANSIECPRTTETETDSLELLEKEYPEILRIVDCSEPDARLDYKLVVRGYR